MADPELPTGTVTFLFTDIEGSTRLIHELGEDGYVQALATNFVVDKEPSSHRLRTTVLASSRHRQLFGAVDTSGLAWHSRAERLARGASGRMRYEGVG